MLAVPYVLSAEDWDFIHGSGPVEGEELKALFERTYEKGQIVTGVKPSNTEDSGE